MMMMISLDIHVVTENNINKKNEKKICNMENRPTAKVLKKHNIALWFAAICRTNI